MVQSIQLQARVMFETLQTKFDGNRNIQNSLCDDVQNEALWELLGLQLSCNVKGIQQTLQRRPEWWLLLSGSVLFWGAVYTLWLTVIIRGDSGGTFGGIGRIP